MTEQYWLPLKMPSGKAKIHIFSRAFIGQKMGFHTESNPTSRNGVETWRNGVETCVIGVKKPGLAKNFKLFCKKNGTSLTGKSFSPIYSFGDEVI